MKKKSLAVATIVTMNLISCTTQEPAPIEYGSTPTTQTSTIQRQVSKLPDSYSESEQIDSKSLEPYVSEPQPTGYLRDPSASSRKTIYTTENMEEEQSTITQPTVKQRPIIEESLDEELNSLSSNEEMPFKQPSTQLSSAMPSINKVEQTNTPKPSEQPILPVKPTITEPLTEEVIAPNSISAPATKPIAQEVISPAASLKFQQPVAGIIITKFGSQVNGTKSNGIDIEAPAGTSIMAAKEGEVIYIGNDPKFGNLVIIKHPNGNLFSAYAHLESINVQKGAQVNQNSVIGKVGKTGNVTKPQLHFAIREGKTPVDPLKYISK